MSPPVKVKPETAHDFVRLDLVPEQVPRAELGAIAALVAGRFADVVHLVLRPGFARHQVMIAGDDDQTAGSLGHDVVEIEGERAHHDPADENAEVLDGGAAGNFQQVAEGRADRDPKRFRLLDGAADRQELFGHRAILPGEVYVVQRLDVVYDASYVERNAGGRDQAAGGGIYELVLVARRVKVAEEDEFDAVVLQGVPERFDALRRFSF